MKTKRILSVLALVVISLTSFTATAQKLVASKTHIKFFSTTPVEDIEANNYKVISSIDLATGVVVFSIPMQSFEFEKALMQKHFNQPKFLDTQQFPKAKFKGAIVNKSKVDFSKDGTYTVEVKGDLTLHGITKNITEKGTITIKDGKVSANAKFMIVLADYKIAFEKGKPSKNISKDVEVTIALKF